MTDHATTINNEMTWPSALAILGLCIMFGSNAIAIKYSMFGLGVYSAALIRFIIASSVLIVWARMTDRSLKVPRKKVIPLAIISLSFSCQLLLFYTGLNLTTAARSALITNTQPFFVLFLAHFFIPGDRINIKKILGISLAFAGIVFVFADKTSSNQELRSGDLLVLLGAMLWGCNAVYTKLNIDGLRSIHLALYPMMVSIPISFLGTLFIDENPIKYVDISIIGSMIFQSFVVAAFGYVAWNSMLKKYGAVSLHSFIFVMPITGVFLGGLVLGEPITSNLLIGMCLIVIGLLAIHLKRKTVPPVFTISRNV